MIQTSLCDMHRAIMVQLGFYFHMQQALGSTRIALTWPLLCAICFMLVFSVVIALFKDIPDVKGDSQVSPLPCHAFSHGAASAAP